MSGAAAGAIAAIASVTGTRPETCPWRAYGDADVQEVLAAHRRDEKHQLYQAYPDFDPPAWLVDAVEYYDTALDRVRASVKKSARIEAEKRASRAPAGWVEDGGGRA